MMKQVGYAIAEYAIRAALRTLPPSSVSEKLALWWGYRFQPKLGIIKLWSGSLIQTERTGDFLPFLLHYTGTFEPHSLAVMREHLTHGNTLLDIGANIGLFSIEGARMVGKHGNVLAVEAAPSHVRALRKSVALNDAGKIVQIIACAVGQASGSATLTLPRHGHGGMFTLGEVEGDDKTRVTVRTIDDVTNGARIDFIKMDIEGSEYAALLGAQQTLLKFHPPILIELNDQALTACGCSSGQVKQLLFSHGYRGVVLNTNRAINLSDAHECDECLFTV